MMRGLFLCAALAAATGASAQIVDGVFDAQLPGTLFTAPWVDVFDAFGNNTTVEPFNNPLFDDGFPTSGTQWAMLISNGPAVMSAPSGAGLHPVGTVSEIRQTITVPATLTFDWTFMTGEGVPSASYNDFATIDLIDPMTGTNLMNLLYVDTGMAAAPINIPGATSPLTWVPSGMAAWFGNEVAPVGPKTASIPIPAPLVGLTLELRIVCANAGDNAVASILYVDTITPSTLPPPPVNQPNYPSASLLFGGSVCSAPGVYPMQRTVTPGSNFNMTISTGMNASQPYALVMGTLQAPGTSTPFGLVNLNIGLPLTVVINGVAPSTLLDQLLGNTGPGASLTVPLYMPAGTPGGIWGSFQAVVIDPAAPPPSYLLTAATEISVGGALPASMIGGTNTFNGDDTTLNVVFTTGFTFPFYGTIHTDAWINSNGSVSFTSGDTTFTETVTGFLSGPPRAAVYWDDMNPGAGGVNAYTETPTSLVVSWVGVPEFAMVNNNNFAIQFDANGLVTMAWGSMDSQDCLVGLSAGGINPGVAIDISATVGSFSAGPLTSFYELFGSAFDLTCGAVAGMLTIVPNAWTTVPGDQGYSF